MVTAAECVLSLPELVSIILYWVYFSEAKAWYTAKFAFFGLSDDGKRPNGSCTLAVASRVNKLWYYEAVRLQWADPTRMSGHSIHYRIGSLPSMEQRQLYAGFVKSGTLPKCHSKNVKAHGRLVEGVFFPKLRALRYRLAANAKRIFLADIDAPEVDTLHVHIGGQEHLDVEFSEKVVYRLIKVVKVGFRYVCTGSVLTSSCL
ncbi:hypothetical protein N7448_004547 [Penicillium atrosanguineum]|uniref:Uncharacterized protein n=1 Tax=Penicillium atrosanguineum TaxID=1132637 RepID=A0A9W9PTA9_9EURO|nr:Tryptophan synthase beta chain [Penicillium atrosanguineum]KAJ5125221.1 hypothetical protein N7526_007398 [Penicillium atrosanguineum]KAJ5135993.1 hypothetical protein N7448_004547 [Penicillium atrosanguineum]KAJ5292347.1 Tryptophan synthase beta chain [Penicillium atrosanguineum]KAJ5303633.1 hypothetical protein N7476_010432 [Penicillium atrosanguineum]